MFKKLLITSAIASFAVSAAADGKSATQSTGASISAFENIYVTGTAGYSKSMDLKGDFGKNNMKNSAILGLGVKTDVCDKAKVGLAFEYRPGYKANATTLDEDGESDNHNGKFKVMSLMLTGSYDIYNYEDFITPYVEAGLGFARVKTGPINYSSAYTAFSFKSKAIYNPAYSLGLGARFKLDENASLSVGYKFSDFGKTKRQTTIFNDELEHLGKAKLRSNDLLLTLEYKL